MQSACNQRTSSIWSRLRRRTRSNVPSRSATVYRSASLSYPLSTPTCPSDEGGHQLAMAISLQSVPLEHAHTCPLRSAAPLSPRSLTYLMREAISMQSACNQHAISMQSACNQNAIRMQSACNQHAIIPLEAGLVLTNLAGSGAREVRELARLGRHGVRRLVGCGGGGGVGCFGRGRGLASRMSTRPRPRQLDHRRNVMACHQVGSHQHRRRRRRGGHRRRRRRCR